MAIRDLLPLLLAGCAAAAAADDFTATADKIRVAMQSDLRTIEERERDRNRRPLETLQFFGLRDDMWVVELVPGGGWYTKILAPVLAERGRLYLAIGTGRVAGLIGRTPELQRAELLDLGVELQATDRQGIFELAPFSLGVDDIDLVLTFRNMHNFPAETRARINAAAFAALRPGGIYGIVDHTRRHMEPDDAENRRRADPVRIISEVEAAGFEFVDYSDLHYRPEDELRYEVGDERVAGNTDRFTLKFRKPGPSP